MLALMIVILVITIIATIAAWTTHALIDTVIV